MKPLIAGLRTLIAAVLVLFLLLIISFSQGWLTPLVNHFSRPYNVEAGRVAMEWYPLMLKVDDLAVGQGDEALTLERIRARTDLGFLTGEPLELYLQLEKGAVAYQQKATEEIRVAGLSLSEWQALFRADQTSTKPETAAEVVNEADTEGAEPFVVKLNSLQITDFTLNSMSDGSPDLTLNRLMFGPFATDQPERSSSLLLEVSTAGGQFRAEGSVSPMAVSPALDMTLTLTEFSPNHQWLAQIPESFQVTINSKLQVKTALESQGDSQGARLHIAGQLELNQFRLDDMPTRLAAEHLLIDALDVKLDLENIHQPDPQLQLELSGFRLNDVKAQLPDLSYQLEQLQLDRLAVIADARQARIDAGDLHLNGGQLDYQLMKAEAVQPDQESATGTTSPAASDTAPVPEKSENENTAVEEPAAEKVAAEPFALTFNGASIRIEKQLLAYRDLNLEPAPLTELEITDIILTEPRYPATTPFNWQAALLLNGQSQWQLQGDLQTQPFQARGDITQTGLNLPDIAPYADHYAEVHFAQGMMDNKVHFEVTSNSLKGKLGFVFHQLDMTLKGSQASLNLPLQTAFSLLEDSDGTIELSIDLDKKGDDLKVGTGAIVKELLLAATQKGAVAYLKFALQPYGALLTLKDVGAGLLKGGALPLEPVQFETLQQALTQDQQNYARKVGQIMQDKPDFKLNYCYIPSDQELAQLQAQTGDAAKAKAALADLNQKRLTQWRKLFAEQGLGSRLNACQKVNEKPKDANLSQFSLSLKP